MSGYLKFSGACRATDAIARAINDAGTMYHHTSQWTEFPYDRTEGTTPAEDIQKAIEGVDSLIGVLLDELYASYVTRGYSQEEAFVKSHGFSQAWAPK